MKSQIHPIKYLCPGILRNINIIKKPTTIVIIQRVNIPMYL